MDASRVGVIFSGWIAKSSVVCGRNAGARGTRRQGRIRAAIGNKKRAAVGRARGGAARGFDRGERGTRERGAHLGGAHVLLRLVFAHGERERHRPLGALTRATDRTRRRALGVCEPG